MTATWEPAPWDESGVGDMVMTKEELKLRLTQIHHDLRARETQLVLDKASFMTPLSPMRMEMMRVNNPTVYQRLIKCLELRDKEQTMQDEWLAMTGREWRME